MYVFLVFSSSPVMFVFFSLRHPLLLTVFAMQKKSQLCMCVPMAQWLRWPINEWIWLAWKWKCSIYSNVDSFFLLLLFFVFFFPIAMVMYTCWYKFSASDRTARIYSHVHTAVYRLRILDFFSFIQFLGSAGFVVNERVASFVYTPKFLVRWQQIFTGDCTNAHHPSLFLHTRCNIHVIIREKYCLTG